MAEKQKLPPGPRPRVKRVLPPPGDFIALGKSASKPRAALEVDMKPQIPIRKTLPVPASSVAPKRKETIPINPIIAKQPRTFSPSFGRSREISKSLDIQPASTVKLIEAQPIELEDMVLAAFDKNDLEEVDGLICNAIRTLRMNRLKPDPMLYLTLTNLAKLKPIIFASKQIVEHLLQFLRRENISSAVKPKPNTLLSIMTCNILQTAFQNEDSWPQSFMKVYVDDAIGDRAWIDNENNASFVKNIVAIFGTVLPPKTITLASSTLSKGVLETNAGTLNTSVGKAEEQKILEEVGITLESDETPLVQNRYPLHKDELAIHAYINDIVKEQLNKRQMIDSVNRNLLRFLTTVCGYNEVRLLASQRIESWLQNPKLTRPAQELLMSVALNCNSHSAEDVEVIANIVKMRLKTKPALNHYTICIRELTTRHPDNLATVLKHVIYNELSQQRNPNNMSTISVIFSAEPDMAAKYLSLVFLDLLCNREDYLRALRALFREIVRALKFEVNLVEFCRGIMQERKEYGFVELEQLYKDRMFQSVIDLICLGCFLCVSPVVKELAVSLSKGEKRDYSVLQAFQTQISIIQRDAVWFFHKNVLPMYRCSDREFVLGLNRVLFLDTNESYSSKDNWPPESERNILFQLMREVPLSEDALLRLHLLGFEDTPINCADTLDVVEKMVYRAAVLKSGLCGLENERTAVLELLLKLSAYNYPREIQLPHSYTPPSLAISALYWKSWLIMLVLAANSPVTIGFSVWENYPTARCMMEMLITGHYEFPPFGLGELTGQEIRGNDLQEKGTSQDVDGKNQIQRAEKEDIISFEGHLAAATSGTTITEQNSLLIAQLISLDPAGPPRLPPKQVIDQLKNMNETFGLGKMLCRCREPDFLLSIINNQGRTSMPWLADLVHSSEGSLNTLPVQCLCEFLLMKHDVTTHTKHKSIKAKVAARLKELLLGSEATERSATELVKYFIQRWSSSEMREREAAIDGFQSILLLQRKTRTSTIGSEESGTDDENRVSKKSSTKMTIVKDATYTWLHQKLPELPFFNVMKVSLTTALREALYKEVNIERLQAFVIFLINYHKEMGEKFTEDLSIDLAQLVTCRKTIIKNLISRDNENGQKTFYALLDLFVHYIKSQIAPVNEEYQWKNNADQISVVWNGHAVHNGKCASLHVRVVHASIELLTFASVLDNHESLTFLQKTWFPKNGDFEARQADTGERIDIFQHWLRMLMVQSTSDLLVQAGFQDLPCNQLLLFLQTSGLPVASLNRLLTLLDEASESHPKELLQDVVDPDGITNLVELAQSRGACGGEKLCNLLHGGEYEKEEVLSFEEIAKDLSTVRIKDVEMKSTRQTRAPSLTKDFIRSTLMELFCSTNDDHKTTMKHFSTIKQQLARQQIKNDNRTLDLVCETLWELFHMYEGFKLGFFDSVNTSRVLLNFILKASEVTETMRNLMRHLKELQPQSSPLSKIIHHISIRMKLARVTPRVKSRSYLQLLDSYLQASCAEDAFDYGVDIVTLMKAGSVVGIPKDKIKKVAVRIFKEHRSLREPFITGLCSCVINAHTAVTCVDVLLTVIESCERQDFGMLTDWLSVLDPEILRLSPVLQRELLFLEREITAERNSTSYLTSLLAHQAQNGTVDDCLAWLLGTPVESKNFNATKCLDYLTAMFYNPRLWQGRENKHNQMEKDEVQQIPKFLNSIEMNAHIQHLYNLVQMILKELQQLLTKTGSDSHLQERLTTLMEKRLSLLGNLAGNEYKYLRRAVNLARQANDVADETMDWFLKYVYMKWPTLISNLCEKFTDSCELPIENKTELDDLIHRLLLSISEPTGLPTWEEKFNCISLLNRRLAVRHPYAFVRQLPFLLSTLRGKSKMASGTFKLTNQLMYCTHVFGLFDLLRPHVFVENENCKSTMILFLDVFLQLIQSTCLSRDELSMVVKKLVEFLNHYITSGNKHAGEVLQEHESVFLDLAYDYPNFQGLTSICTLITSWRTQPQSNPSLVAIHDAPLSEMQLASFKRRLSADHHHKDLLTVIVDLDETSKRRTDIIKYFIEELSVLLFSTYLEVREKSHMLLIRYFKQNPRKKELHKTLTSKIREKVLHKTVTSKIRNVTSLIDLYMKCFTANQPEIVETAAQYATQAINLTDEKCDLLLNRLFELAVNTTNTNISKHIVSIIKHFNIDCLDY